MAMQILLLAIYYVAKFETVRKMEKLLFPYTNLLM